LILEKEAMWINFESEWLFAVKVYVGGVNAVSGEPATENLATLLRRKTKLSNSQSIQDYVVAGGLRQKWLDGVAKLDGKVMQFVATPAGSRYSVEAQLTGDDSVGGLQFEIIPLKRNSSITITVRAPIDMGGKQYRFVTQPGILFRRLEDAVSKIYDIHHNALRFYCEKDNFGKEPRRIRGSTETFASLGIEDVSFSA
jgi:hypothetical protein